MEKREDSKVEGSIPVQARVNVVSLADLDLYWNSEGYRISTMSQLIGFSIELLHEILESNKKLKQKARTISEANQYLTTRGLYQKSMYNRGYKKLGVSIAFEGMREEGISPESYAPRIYNSLHNERSVKPFMGKVENETIKRGIELIDGLPEPDHSLLDELSGIPSSVREEGVLREGTASSEMAQRIEEADKAQKEALDKLDINELLKTAVKE